MIAALVVTLGVGYLAGAMPWGLWLGRWVRGIDVRQHGSCNLGATNVYRVLGAGLGLATLALDVAKGALPVGLLPRLEITAGFPGGREWCAVAAGFAAVAGHVWTCFAGFRGGKGVATMSGVLLALAPLAFAVFVGVFALTLLVTRYVSLGSVLGTLAFCLVLWLTAPGGWRSPSLMLGIVLGALVILRHRENLARLVRGEERRFSFKGGGPS